MLELCLKLVLRSDCLVPVPTCSYDRSTVVYPTVCVCLMIYRVWCPQYYSSAHTVCIRADYSICTDHVLAQVSFYSDIDAPLYIDMFFYEAFLRIAHNGFLRSIAESFSAIIYHGLVLCLRPLWQTSWRGDWLSSAVLTEAPARHRGT